MALTERMLERRKESLGSSDIGVICGFFGNPYDLFLEKTAEMEPWKGNDATVVGNVVEPGVLNYAARLLSAQRNENVRIKKNQFRVHPTLPFHSNFDALMLDTPEAIECKSSAYEVDLWGDDGTDQIPHAYVCQVQWGMGIVAELERVWVIALLAPRFGSMKLRMYCVERDDELIRVLQDQGMNWWDAHVIQGEAPASVPSERALRRRVRVPNKVVTLDCVDLVNDWSLAKAEARSAQKIQEELQAALISEMGDAESGVLPDGRMVTFFEHNRKGYKVAPTSFRRLSVSKGGQNDDAS